MPDEHTCAENVHVTLNVQFFGNTNIKYLEVKLHCSLCGKPARFRGNLVGLSPTEPTIGADGAEAIFPFLFEGEEYDGKAMGYLVSSPHGGDN